MLSSRMTLRRCPKSNRRSLRRRETATAGQSGTVALTHVCNAMSVCHDVPRRGDTVKIMSGPNINPSVSGKYLRVEFIITTDLIVFSPSIESNRGFMAVKASLVETPGPPKVDPSMPAPFSGSGGHSGMQQQHPYSVDGMSIGSSVRIVKGVHKGKDGVVRKIMGNKMSVQVRGGQQVEVSSDMIKSDDPNSAGSFGFARSEGSQSQQSYRTPHIPFSPGHSLPTSSPAPASPAPSGWSHSGTGYGSSTIGSSRFGTPGSSVARSPAPFSGSSGMGSAWTSQSPAPNTPGTHSAPRLSSPFFSFVVHTGNCNSNPDVWQGHVAGGLPCAHRRRLWSHREI